MTWALKVTSLSFNGEVIKTTGTSYDDGKVTLHIDIADKTLEWTQENLGYVPDLVAGKEDDLGVRDKDIYLVFRDGVDAGMFRIAFGHLNWY